MNKSYLGEQIYFTKDCDYSLNNTNQKKVEELLERNIAVGVVGGFYEENYPVYFISHFALRNLGYTFDEFMMKTNGNFLEIVSPEDRIFFEKGLKKKSDHIREYRVLNNKNEDIWIKEMHTESESDDGRKLWLCSIRLAQNEHIYRKKFISTISHDIRTPLNAIIGMARLAKINYYSKEKMEEYLNLVIKSSYHLLNQIDEVLDMNSIETGVMLQNENMFNLGVFISDIENMFKPVLKEREQNLRVIYNGVRHWEVIGDNINLKKVFVNILANASKYSDDKSDIELIVEEVHSSSQEYAEYKFTFADHGIGISEDMLELIFEPFERIVDSRNTGDIPHIGLGLAVTKSIVDMMHGSLEVESELQSGSKFILTQKIKIQTYENVKAVNAMEHDLEGMRILIVEDNDLNQKIVGELLEIEKVKVEMACNGKEAAEIFDNKEKGYYDAILMDIHMPVMNGYESTDMIRKNTDKGGDIIPIIALTSDTLASDVEKSLKHGMNGHMSKPVDFEELKETLLFWKNKKHGKI